MTSNKNGERQGQGQRTSRWGDCSFFRDRHQSQDACQDAHQSNRDCSRDCKAWDTALAKTIAEAVAREMAKDHAHYQALLNDRSTATIQTSLKVSSGANGFKVMDPFNWTKDKSIYQRWQLWSEKAMTCP